MQGISRRARAQERASRNPARPFVITRRALDAIRDAIGSRPAEQGGALGGSRTDGTVRHFHFDASARRSGATYSPDHVSLNNLFADEWNPAGINLLGFVHSHPPGFARPSGGDAIYARAILDAIPELDRLLLPIVQTEADTGRFDLHPFVASRDKDGVRIDRLELVVLEDAEKPIEPTAPVDTTETFRRVRDAYDLPALAESRVVYVGIGGAAQFAEDLARAGVGEHVLIDPDVVTETNLATQQVYRRDLGRPKVACLADRIRDVNPNAVVVSRQQTLDEIDDREFGRLALEPLAGRPPRLTLVCGLTDSFEAQARVNRIALNLGLPSLCAQVYHEGLAAEITFTVPGVTPACHRCVLNGRYREYRERGFENDVTSDGTPIFATTRLNALKGFLALAILHASQDRDGEPQARGAERWRRLLARVGERNLVQIRMDPDVGSALGLRVFDAVFGGGDANRIVFDDVVWLPQAPDRPENGFPHCPDCRGTGDLRDAAGTFDDTRLWRE
jgi:proteasome lid subunit RPN8/RPN11